MRYLCKTPALPALLVLCWLGCSSLALAADPGVHDQAGLFNKESIDKANAMLRDIHDKTKKTVVIETYKGVPVDKRDAFRANREKFYQDWVMSRAKSLNLRGTFFLVCKETTADVTTGTPHNRVEFWTDSETETKWTKEEANQFKDLLGKQLTKDPNKGLLDAVSFAQQSMETKFAASRPLANAVEQGVKAAGAGVNTAKDVAKKQWQNVQEGKMDTTTIIIYIVVGLLAFWILIGIVRAFTRPRYQPGGYAGQPQQMGQPMGGGPPPGYGQPYGQPMGYGGYPQRSGSGFLGNMMAGMFGAVAGNYMYNHWFGGGQSQSFGGNQAGTTGGLFGGGNAASDAPQTGYVGGGDYPQEEAAPSAPAGGDYDQDVAQQSDFGSGGSDFGGGGGGDTGGGGGDFGGGGGDFGGGGGDFGGGGGGDF